MHVHSYMYGERRKTSRIKEKPNSGVEWTRVSYMGLAGWVVGHSRICTMYIYGLHRLYTIPVIYVSSYSFYIQWKCSNVRLRIAIHKKMSVPINSIVSSAIFFLIAQRIHKHCSSKQCIQQRVC